MAQLFRVDALGLNALLCTTHTRHTNCVKTFGNNFNVTSDTRECFVAGSYGLIRIDFALLTTMYSNEASAKSAPGYSPSIRWKLL